MLKLARFRVLSTNDSFRQPLDPSLIEASCAGARNDYLALNFCLDLGDGVATRCTAPRHRPNTHKRDARRDRSNADYANRLYGSSNAVDPSKLRVVWPDLMPPKPPGLAARRLRTAAAADALLRAPLPAAARFVGPPGRPRDGQVVGGGDTLRLRHK